MAANLIFQFFVHTELIRKFPKIIELIFNTPSHHRAHHASNIRYLDTNHAGVLIIWDRMFGTFVEEKSDVVYGIKENVKTFNPVKITFLFWQNMVTDYKNSKNLNISFDTKKKIGNAVKRNKIKRRLRNIMNEAVKNITINFNYSFLVIAKSSMLNNEYKIIKKTIFCDFEKIK